MQNSFMLFYRSKPAQKRKSFLIALYYIFCIFLIINGDIENNTYKGDITKKTVDLYNVPNLYKDSEMKPLTFIRNYYLPILNNYNIL